MKITAVFDTTRLKADLASEARKLRSTARRAVNELAWQGNEAVREEIARSFDRPTDYVLNGTMVRFANDETLVAEVDWKPGGGNKGGIPASRILKAQIEGGARVLKRFERALALPPDRIAVPAKWAELDAHGNIKAGQLVKILSYLRLFGEQGYTANRTNRRSRGARAAESYFIIRPGTNHKTLSPGVYRIAQDMGGAPLMVLAFVRAANYRARFNPALAVRRRVDAIAAATWNLALQRQLPFRR